MPAGIFGQRFIVRGERNDAWHRAGTNFVEPETVEGAVARIGANYRVELYPNKVDLPNGQTLISDRTFSIVRGPLPKTQLNPATNVVEAAEQLLRDYDARLDGYGANDYEIFGTVSHQYEILQNEEFFHKFDGIIEYWPIETAGILDNGRIAWMLFNAGQQEMTRGPLKGDVFARYAAAINYLDGERSMKILATNVRIVCKNTLILAKGEARFAGSIQHRNDARDELSYNLEQMASVMKAQDEVIEAFEELSRKEIMQEELEEFLRQCFKEPAKPKELTRPGRYPEARVQQKRQRYEWQMDDIKRTREAVKELFEQENDTAPAPETRGSAYLLYNAVCEERDYNWRFPNEKQALSVLFGERAADKKRAYEILSRM